MKILITGGAGFIGSAVVRRAVSAGHSVVNLDKLTYAANPASVAGLDPQAYVFEQIDICDADAVVRAFERYDPDAVMHLAAESHVDRSIDGPMAFVDTNVKGTAVVLEAARAHLSTLSVARREAFRFHHISTDEVYGTLGESGCFDETTPYNPNSPYSASKAAADMLVRAWGETFGLPVLITNCSNNYGAWQFPEKLIPVVVFSALAGLPIPIYGQGLNVRDWLFVEDHAEALLLVLEKGQPGETYCIGGASELTNIEIVQRICEVVDALRPQGAPHSRLITHVADRPGHDFRYAIDFSKITRELGWRPRTSLAVGLAETVEWYVTSTAGRQWASSFSARRQGQPAQTADARETAKI
ncbi:MAG: dTDP-glucose 4,6-dehydratase [Brevundimonas sp.]|uniref:dTDP-glucose 4,6-dehydratase n=1 Tax=Brevundimonas sp. TaxID=1871086 RepID=UPI00391CC023